MEEKILEIMNENSSDANNGQMSVVTEDSYSDVADEIADIFRKFIEWTHKGAFYFRNNFTEGWTLNGVSHNSLLNDDELFDYWRNNIKDK